MFNYVTYVLPEHEPGPEEVEGGLGPDPLIRHVEHDLLQLVHGETEHTDMEAMYSFRYLMDFEYT